MKRIFFLLSSLLVLSCSASHDLPQKQDSYFQNAHECPEDSTANRIGAVCNDGTYSESTGSGTCSHHGGVKTWLCK